MNYQKQNGGKEVLEVVMFTDEIIFYKTKILGKGRFTDTITNCVRALDLPDYNSPITAVDKVEKQDIINLRNICRQLLLHYESYEKLITYNLLEAPKLTKEEYDSINNFIKMLDAKVIPEFNNLKDDEVIFLYTE